MADESQQRSTRSRDELDREYIVRELERRIQKIEQMEESAFGRFTALDWVICVIAFVILPHAVLWLFAAS